MRIHALSVIRDEGDIIEQSLRDAAKWCDHIYVYDTGSTDGSWDIVQALARDLKQIVPYRREAVWFHDGLRSVIFDHYRAQAEDGDWFIRLDADEFYPISPAQFIKERLRRVESIIYNQTYEFKLTRGETEGYPTEASVLLDRKRPIQDRRRFFIPLRYSEPRLFQYRRRMCWLPNAPWPFNCGFVARERMPVQHYPHRDPIQMKRRFHVRNIMRRDMRILNPAAIAHWDVTNWQEELVKSSDDRLLFWEPGTSLPQIRWLNHIASPWKRSLQWALYRTCVRAIDATRPTFPREFVPVPVPMDTIKELATCP